VSREEGKHCCWCFATFYFNLVGELSPLDKPQTWNDMKFVMRENFVNPSLVINSNDEVFQLEDQSIVVSLAMTNLLQDSEQTQEDKDCAKENEELTTSCANSEPSPHNSPSTPAENESKGNESIATLTDGETSLDVLNFSTNHASIEQLLVEPPLDLFCHKMTCSIFLVIKMIYVIILLLYMF